MPTRARVSLQADLAVQLAGPDCSSVPSDAGSYYSAGLKGDTRAAELVDGTKLAVIDSPGAFAALGVSANMNGRFLWLRVLEGDDIDVQVTHATQGATTYPVHGLLVLEPSEDELITAVAVQGEATIEWVLTGDQD